MTSGFFTIGTPHRPSVRRWAAALTLLALTTPTACAGPPEPALEIAGVAFTSDDLLGLSPDRRLLLGQLAAFARVVADSALDELTAPRVVDQSRLREWSLLRAAQILDSAGVDDAVLRARYRSEPELELTVRHLLVFSDRAETEATRALAQARAQAALERIRAGEDLAVVAAEVSEEPGAKARQGLLTPGREGSWVDEFWTAARALDPGDVSPVTETQYGFHVLRLEARDTVPFDEARTRVALELARQISRLPSDFEDVPQPPTPEATGPSELEATAAARSWRDWRAVRAADPGAITRIRSLHARQRWVAERARARGLESGDAWIVTARRDEIGQAEQQARLLGLGVGLQGEGLHDAVLEALSQAGQNANLARMEIRNRYGGLLALRYPELLQLEAEALGPVAGSGAGSGPWRGAGSTRAAPAGAEGRSETPSPEVP
jgi:hypothetical protein